MLDQHTEGHGVIRGQAVGMLRGMLVQLGAGEKG